MVKKNLTLQIGMGIVVGILILAFLNAGFFLAMDQPQFNDFCEEPQEGDCEFPGQEFKVPCEQRDCDNEAYEEELSSFRMIQYLVFALAGFVLLLLAVFVPLLFVQILGFVGGLGALIEANIFIRDNLILLFVTLGLMIALIIFFVVRKLMKDLK